MRAARQMGMLTSRGVGMHFDSNREALGIELPQ